eukprot:CAMPEP_0117075294 /NCGR_PEP_ID=MMETSP0472-20121206/53085_1 /TAXON_ID=693140 ORGANISM="Tiarina fusus, Strain LIS" /NCGR_SAMPLE_ID=MMETSP0472 /ASSEMBLY_ACC=CAM_ASM_000603 /LENGTH=47 /DNA_ID= /DNA_START= /DNA_END= /DNA_ORIENTATION=
MIAAQMSPTLVLPSWRRSYNTKARAPAENAADITREFAKFCASTAKS